jgi:hypothetical protein
MPQPLPEQMLQAITSFDESQLKHISEEFEYPLKCAE